MTHGNTTMSSGQTMRAAAIALAIGILLAVAGWVFAQDTPVTTAPPVPAAAPAPLPSKPDPAGTATGGIADVTAKMAGKPTLEEAAEAAGHNKASINVMWTLVAGFLVMFTQAGFALAESGFTRGKNAGHTREIQVPSTVVHVRRRRRGWWERSRPSRGAEGGGV